jgi:hypothetical protein
MFKQICSFIETVVVVVLTGSNTVWRYLAEPIAATPTGAPGQHQADR